ncbi:MAG: response regulator [Candidatus Eisenbacteria bacterium]
MRPRRVLLVEDDPDTATGLQLLLEHRGYTVAIILDGNSALQAVADFLPDVIVCDLTLAGAVDGHSIAAALRGHPTLRSIRRVALSGHADEGTRQLAHASGFDSYLVKPVALEALESALGTCSI